MPDFGSALWNKPAAADDSTQADPVTRSLRFKDADNSHLYFDPTATHDSTTVYTFSCWAKLGEMSAESYEIFTAGYYISGSDQDLIYFGHNADSKMRVWLRSTHDSTNTTYTSSAVFRDPSAWYHLLLVRNGASLKVYVNNTEVISETISSTQRYGVGNGYAMHVGSSVKPTQSSVSSYSSFDGLLADIYFTDGYAKAPTDFIEDAGYGAYKPKAYTGEFGTNGFHIDAQPAHDADLLVTSVSRSDGDTTFADVAAGHTVSRYGHTEHSIAVGNPFTGDDRAIYFDGNGDKIETGTTTDFNFGTGDFTIECWINPSQVSSTWEGLLASDNYGGSGHRWVLYQSGDSIYWRAYSGSTSYTNYIIADVLEVHKWQHIAVTRTSGTLKIFLDGVEQTSSNSDDFSAYDFSDDTGLRIGYSYGNYNYQGYMYDVRVVNGTAITPPSGGPTSKLDDATNTKLLLQPDKDDSSWVDESGNQTLTGSGDLSTVSPVASTPYDAAAKSTAMYFDGSGDYLTIGTSSDFRVTSNNFTLDFWYKAIDDWGNVFSNTPDGNVYDGFEARCSTSGVLAGFRNSSSSNDVLSLQWDTSSDTDWHHVEVSRTGSNVYLFIDGTLEDSGTLSFTPTDSGVAARIGRRYGDSYPTSNNYEGYLFDYRWSNSGGHTASFTAPTAPLELNPVYIGGDQSGNKNHFTVSGISITHDVLLDCPTKNYCLINPLAETKTDSSSYDSNPTTGLSEGNLKLTSSALFFNGHGTLGVSSGKWYFEWYSTGDWVQGGFTTHEMFSNKDQSLTDFWVLYNRDSTNNIAVQYKDGTGSANAGWAGGGHASGNGNVFGCAFDVDNRKMYFHKNGEWYDGSSMTSTFPSSHGGDLTGSSHSIPADTTFFPTVRAWTSSTVIANFGQDSTFANTVSSGSANAADANGNGDFRYTPPSGYLALCTANLDAPSVTPSEHFNTVLYTGDGNTNHDITGVGFESALTWIKSRSSRWHQWYDAARGAGKVVHSNSKNSESDNTAYFGPFQSDGFRLAPTTSGTGENASGENYVAWNWKAHQIPSTGARTSYTVKVEDNSGDGWDANTSWIDGSNFPTLYMELFENQTSGLVSLGKVAVRSLDDDGNSGVLDQSEQTYILKCVDLDAIAVKWYYDTSGDGQESDYPYSYNDYLNDQKITILDGSTSEWTINNHSNDDGATDYNYSPPTGWANGDTLKSATTSYTGSDQATLVSSEPVEKYNAAAGFSIISYTGNKSADGNADGDTQEITHSLGAEPELIITKSRGSGGYDEGKWEVYHKHTVMDSSHSDNGIHPQLWLNENYDAYQGSYNPAIPKSGSANTIIEVTNDNGYGHYANESGLEYIMYAWAPVDGYSKFGSYVGNGSSAGPMVYTGFRPALVIMKKTTASGAWHLFDNKRSGYNYANDVLQPDSNDAELSGQTYEFVDLLSNGFKVRRTTHGPNSSGETYIYAAFSESPLKYANAR